MKYLWFSCFWLISAQIYVDNRDFCPKFCQCSLDNKVVTCSHEKWIYLPRDLNSNSVEKLEIAAYNNIRYLRVALGF